MTNHRESFMSFGKKVSHLERGPELNLGPRKIYLFDNQGETRYISSKEAKDTPPASLTEKLGGCVGIGEPRVCLKAKLLITNITNIDDIGYMKCSQETRQFVRCFGPDQAQTTPFFKKRAN